MRDPERLDYFYSELKSLHKKYFPDWRFAQLINNFMSWHYNHFGNDAFYLEDYKFMERFHMFVGENGKFK